LHRARPRRGRLERPLAGPPRKTLALPSRRLPLQPRHRGQPPRLVLQGRTDRPHQDAESRPDRPPIDPRHRGPLRIGNPGQSLHPRLLTRARPQCVRTWPRYIRITANALVGPNRAAAQSYGNQHAHRRIGTCFAADSVPGTSVTPELRRRPKAPPNEAHEPRLEPFSAVSAARRLQAEGASVAREWARTVAFGRSDEVRNSDPTHDNLGYVNLRREDRARLVPRRPGRAVSSLFRSLLRPGPRIRACRSIPGLRSLGLRSRTTAWLRSRFFRPAWSFLRAAF